MADDRMPVAEVDVDAELVRGLLADQHPDLGDLPLERVANGWDNVLFRLGDHLVVRMPRRAVAAPLVRNEQRWLPDLAGDLPVPVPVPVRRGRPGRGFPWHWSVCPWFEGTVLAEEPPHDPGVLAADLGGFLAALHRPAPADAPRNPWRGVPLADRSEITRSGIARLAGVAGLERVRPAEVGRCWEEWRGAPVHTGPPVWIHGDPHPANLLLARGRLSAVLDFGDLCAGDPASDLAVAWMALPAAHRPVFRTAAGDPDGPTWTRARAWALAIAVACLVSSADAPVIRRIGERTLDAVLADDERV